MSKDRLWNVVLCLTAVMLLSMGVSRVFYGWSSVFSFRAFWIVSESMEPTIRENHVVVGRLVGDGELTVGEIYAYRREGVLGKEIVIHRLVGITEEGYLFQGDANEQPDKVIVRDQVGYKIVWY